MRAGVREIVELRVIVVVRVGVVVAVIAVRIAVVMMHVRRMLSVRVMMVTRRVLVSVLVRLGLHVDVRVSVSDRQPSADFACDGARAKDRDEDTGCQRDPRIDLLGDDPARGGKDDGAEREDAGGMRHRERGCEDDGLARRRACADQRHGQQRLAVTGLEGVQRPERDREEQRAEHDERIPGTFSEDV